jgi:hypothetical protein
MTLFPQLSNFLFSPRIGGGLAGLVGEIRLLNRRAQVDDRDGRRRRSSTTTTKATVSHAATDANAAV